MLVEALYEYVVKYVISSDIDDYIDKIFNESENVYRNCKIFTAGE